MNSVSVQKSTTWLKEPSGGIKLQNSQLGIREKFHDTEFGNDFLVDTKYAGNK